MSSLFEDADGSRLDERVALVENFARDLIARAEAMARECAAVRADIRRLTTGAPSEE